MGKKSLKTNRQILILTRYFKQKQDDWPKSQVISLAKETGLSRTQVYKWLWDQRNLQRTIQKDQSQAMQPNSYLSQYGFIDQKMTETKVNKWTAQRVRKITIKSQSNEISVDTPENVEFAVKFIIPASTSIQFQSLLKKYGSQLIRVSPPIYENCEQKKEKLFKISEFNEIKEQVRSFLR